MIVLVDIGNSRCKYSFYHQGQLSAPISVDNNVLSSAWLSAQWAKVTSVITASVKQDEVTQIVSTWCQQQNIAFKQVKTEAEKAGIVAGYKNYSLLGIDRWLVILAAAKLYPQKNVLVVDAGTATTVDLLTKKGIHQGGWILPGISMMNESLKLNTAQVQVDEQILATINFGTSTEACVNSAIWAATIAMIEKALVISKKQQTEIDEIIVTGGNAKQLKELMCNEITHIENLIFHGLVQYI